MTDPFVFATTSPRFGMPLLFSGQAQKEIFVNEGFSLIDSLLHCAVEGEQSAPPPDPADGQNWIVGASATGDWLGKEGSLAWRQGGSWLFVTPRDGVRALDRSTGQERLFLGSWLAPAVPAEPMGGSTVDAEARTAIGALVMALRSAGVFPTT